MNFLFCLDRTVDDALDCIEIAARDKCDKATAKDVRKFYDVYLDPLLDAYGCPDGNEQILLYN